MAASTRQPLLQARLTAFELHVEAVRANGVRDLEAAGADQVVAN